MRPSDVMCAAGVLWCAGASAVALPAWAVEDSRVRVFADGFVGGASDGPGLGSGLGSGFGDGACPSFSDGVLLEFPGAAFQSRTATIDGGATEAASHAVVSMDGNVVAVRAHASSRADAVGSDGACLSAAFASSRMVAEVPVELAESVVCVDVRFSARVAFESALLGDWARVSVVSPDGSARGVVAGPSGDGDVSGAVRFGRVVGPIEAGGRVVIETLTPLADPSSAADRRVDARAIARLYTADLAAPFAVLGPGDVAAFVDGYLASDCAFDFDGSGWVDLGDIDAFLTLFLGGSCPTVALVRTGGVDVTRPGAPCGV